MEAGDANPDALGHRLPKIAVQGARMSLASNPIHDMIQPSKSNPNMF